MATDSILSWIVLTVVMYGALIYILSRRAGENGGR